MADTTFTLTFKTIAQLTGLDQLINGVQAGAKQVENINQRLQSIASTANTVLSAFGSYLALSKLEEFAHKSTEAREQQAAFAVQVLRSRDGSQELLEELNKLNLELAETTATSEVTSRAIERQLLLFGATKEQIGPLTKAIIEFSAARGKSPEEVTMFISRALAGEDLMLSRLGLHLDKTKDHASQVQQLIDQLGRGGGNTAEVMKSASGWVAEFELSWARLERAIGNVVNLVRIPFFVALTNSIEGLKDKINGASEATGGWSEKIYVMSGLTGAWVGQNLQLIASIAAVGGGLLLLRTSIALLGPQATVAVAGIAAITVATNSLAQKVTGVPVTVGDAFSAWAKAIITIFTTVKNNLGASADLLVAYVTKIINEAIAKFYELAKISAQIVNVLSLGTVNIDTSQFDGAIEKFKAGARTAGDESAAAATKLVEAGNAALDKIDADFRKKWDEIRKRGLTGDDLEKQLKENFEKWQNAIKNIKAPSGSGFIEDLDPGKAAKNTAATDALTAAKQRLTAAELSYKNTLETTKLLEDAGQITHDQANARNLQATRDYIAELERVKATLPAVIAQLEAMGSKGAKGAGEARLEYQQLSNKILEAETTLANSTVFGKIRAQIRQLANDWSDVGKQVGGFLAQQFQNFASTAGNAIGQLIFRTGNWKQSIVQLAQSFVSSLATMLIQWVLSRTIMSALNKAFGVADAKAATAQAGEAAAAWSVPGIAASIATEGIAAGTGLAAYLAAIGTGVAASIGISAGGGFQGGGFTGHGPENKIAGPAHYEEVIFPADRVRYWGRETLVNMAVGSLTQPGYQRGGVGGGRPGSGATGPAIGGGDHTVIIVNDWESAVHQALRNAKGRTLIVDAISGRSVDLGLQS